MRGASSVPGSARPSPQTLGITEMFDFFKRKKSDPVGALTNQVIGGQSVMYRLFRQALSCEDSSIRKLELTYFAASVMTFVYLPLSKRNDNEQVLDAFTRNIIQQSIPSSKEQITFAESVKEYQLRYQEYGGLLSLLLNPSKSSSDNPAITLLMHVFERVTGSPARGHMVRIAAASGLIQQYVADHVDFVKKKL
jgi:hypothetical protein